MSAAEKLRALMRDERWKSHDSTVLAGLALEFYGASGHGALPKWFRALVQGHITVDEYVADIKRRVHQLALRLTWLTSLLR